MLIFPSYKKPFVLQIRNYNIKILFYSVELPVSIEMELCCGYLHTEQVPPLGQTPASSADT